MARTVCARATRFTATAAMTLICFAPLTPAAATTPTHTASPTIQSVGGTVLAPGTSGLEPVAGIGIEAFICRSSPCLDESDIGMTADTTSTGQFVVSVRGAGFVVVRASLESDVLRGLAYEPGAVTVDPTSEAMVLLLVERDLSVYTSAQLRRIEDEIRRANATADFADLAVADAVALALANARADAAVDAALVAWTPTPRPTSTPTSTATATPTPYPAVATATRRPCVGDCDRSTMVTVDELVSGVRMVLGTAGPEVCPAFDDPRVPDLIQAVTNALGECVPPPPLPDLAIDGDRVYVYGETCRLGKHCGSACIINAGNAAAGAFEVFFGTRMVLPGLAAGEGQCVGLCLELLPYMGAVTIDADDAVEELDEDNNTFAFVYPTATPPPSCP